MSISLSGLVVFLVLFISELQVFNFFHTNIVAYRFSKGQTRLYHESTPEWWLQTDDLVINRDVFDKEKPQADSNHLFDALYKNENSDSVESQNNGLISSLSLRDISQAYGFSLYYLGDFICEMGCPAPVDVDSRIGDLLTGEQVFTLLQALTSLDPLEAGCDYDTLSLPELAEEVGLSVDRVYEICKEENINLPFGINTRLHTKLAESVKSKLLFDE